MPCSIHIGGDAIYWGLANAVTYDATTFESWLDAQVTALLGELNSDVASDFDPDGYFFDNAGGDTNTYAWLVVPDSWDTPLKELGIRYSLGASPTPTDIVRARHFNPARLIPTSEDALIWNGYDGSETADGWKYSLKTVSGTLYRFYVFRQWKLVQDNSMQLIFPGTFDSVLRTSDAQYYYCPAGAGAGSQILTWCTVTSVDLPSYNLRGKFGIIDFSFLYSFLNAYSPGANDTNSGTYTITTSYTSCQGSTLDCNIGDLEFTLFVETASVPQTADTIYWGFADSTTYDPSDWESWSGSKFTSFLASLTNSESGPYRVTPYHFTTASSNQIAWIAVPCSYAEPIDTSGFNADILSVNYGVLDSDISSAYQGQLIPQTEVSNGYITTNDEQVIHGTYAWASVFPGAWYEFSGWTWFVRNINGNPYRFYPFVLVYSNNVGVDPGFTRFWNDGTTPTEMDLTITT